MRVNQSTSFASSCCSPPHVLYVGAAFARASARASVRQRLYKLGRTIGRLNVFQPLNEESGSPITWPATSQSASRLSLPIIRRKAPIDSEILVIVTTLTLASSMAGFGRTMSPLDAFHLSGHTFIQTQSVFS